MARRAAHVHIRSPGSDGCFAYTFERGIFMKYFYRLSWVLGVLLLAGALFAQTTGSLTGRAALDGNALPGVTVTVTSPNLQGARVAVTDVNGNYNLGALPPGAYTVKFEMEGMQT